MVALPGSAGPVASPVAGSAAGPHAAVDAGAMPDHPAPQGWINRLAANRAVQRLAARVPGLRRLVRAEGAAIFDLMQGFVRSQVLAALVELRLLQRLAGGPLTPAELAAVTNLPEDRLAVLLQAGAGIGLLRRRGAAYGLTHRGAAFLGVPGLEALVQHHRVLYGDLADPAAFFAGRTDPDLARFWPYVFGGAAPDAAARYSRLMAQTQALVADDTLDQADLRGVAQLLDVGGGSGAFLRAVHARHPGLGLALFDLPPVVAVADLPPDTARHGGSFRTDPLPQGADAISLIRVLYDHADETVAGLLSRVHQALPPGGRVLISEPMSGGARPDPQTDVYFAVYTLAMQTGRTRSAAQVGAALSTAGFTEIHAFTPHRPYVTAVVTARRP